METCACDPHPYLQHLSSQVVTVVAANRVHAHLEIQPFFPAGGESKYFVLRKNRAKISAGQ